jgi:hypothetical protein
MTRKAVVIVVVAVVVLVAVWFFAVYNRPTQQAQQPPTPPPPTSVRPPHKPPTPGACAASSAPGSGYEMADCPTTCVAGTTAQDVTYSIDDYLNPKPSDPTGGDPDICLSANRGDTLSFAADTSGGRQVNVAGYKSNGKPANPFVGTFPLPVPASGKTPAQKLRKNLPPLPNGKCWVFHGSFDVKDSHGQNCYDPHIYTEF